MTGHDGSARRDAGGVDGRLLVLLLVAVFLALAAWRTTRAWRPEPARTSFVLARNLMMDLRHASFVRTSERLNLANPRGRRHTVEATREQPRGVLSRPDRTPPAVWLLGDRPGFDLDVVEPTDRTLALVLADETEAVQRVTVLFNGEDLGTTTLRRDGVPMPVLRDVPAEDQVVGRNRVQLLFEAVEERTLPDETGAWPVAARLLAVRFLLPGEDHAPPPPGARDTPVPRLASADDPAHPVMELALPAGSLVSVAADLPDEERVALRFQVVRADAPLEAWAVPDDAPPVLLTRTDPALVATPLVFADVSPWSGRPLRVDLRVPGDAGEVAVRGLALLLPSTEEPDGDARAATEAPSGGDEGADDAASRDGGLDGASGDVAPEPVGTLFVLRDGELPRLALLVDDLRLEVDLATRTRRLYDLSTPDGSQRDLSTSRPASAQWLHQELCAIVQRDYPDRGWVEQLRLLLVRT